MKMEYSPILSQASKALPAFQPETQNRDNHHLIINGIDVDDIFLV